MSDKPVIGKVVFGGKHEPELHMPDIDCPYCEEKSRRIEELERRLDAVRKCRRIEVTGVPGRYVNVANRNGLYVLFDDLLAAIGESDD